MDQDRNFRGGEPGTMTPLTVLVVDDDPGIRESLTELLRAEGHVVRTAENGAAALEIMRAQPRPDVVVLDLMMPVMSGWEVLAEVECDASLHNVPILVVSAMAAPVAAPHQRGGVRMCLPKPLDVDILLDAISDLTVVTVATSGGRRRASAAR
jgi:CheY-like chemotaxis protein